MSENISIHGATTHNLKNISIDIPKNSLVVITGVSGSGKSSLAFDTLYAEGQRRYLESLSTYARMIVSEISNETKVVEIRGLSPTIAIHQKTVSNNPRSTVGTITEIYDYYRLMYSTIGEQYCPDHPHIHLRKNTTDEVLRYIETISEGSKYAITFPLPSTDTQVSFEEIRSIVTSTGFVRYMIGDVQYSVADAAPDTDIQYMRKDVYVVVDRCISKKYIPNSSEDISTQQRVRDSLRVAFEKTEMWISIYIFGEVDGELRQNMAKQEHNIGEDGEVKPKKSTSKLLKTVADTKEIEQSRHTAFSLHARCSECGYTRGDLGLSHFSFNSHYGACTDCHGLGMHMTFHPEDVINATFSISEGAILPWNAHPYYTLLLETVCRDTAIDIHTPYEKLSQKHKNIILYGTSGTFTMAYVGKYEEWKTHKSRYEGVIPNLERRYAETETKGTDTYMKRIEKFATEEVCRTCSGGRIKKEYLAVRIAGKNIAELTRMSVRESISFFDTLKLSTEEEKISGLVLKNIRDRLQFLQGVGLGYVSLERRANTLSGWESQRIRLATQIGTKLEGIIYVLDEPSIWLHPQDNNMLIENLKKLVQIGNSVVVVEHDEDIMRESDHIIDIGPRAGVHGGEIIFQGTYDQICTSRTSETGKYLSYRKSVERKNPKQVALHIPKKSISTKSISSPTFATLSPTSPKISIVGAIENNLKNVSVDIPLGVMTVVTGVSGSGKSSLIMDTLSVAAVNHFNESTHTVGKHTHISGFETLDKAIIIDQAPIGRTPHSNIATYTGVFTFIREVFAASVDAGKRGFGPGRFSFNTRGWRCEICEWLGMKKIEMHFLPDVYVQCESCLGTRYNSDTLSVQFKWKNIAEVLAMTIDDACIFFAAFPRILRIVQVLSDVGLGYITLGQSAPTLSGGESQRIKLAFDLSKRSTGTTLYILDEPTTGLHFSDIQKLLDILDLLVQKWNTVVIIEHNLDIITNADYILEIWPEWGKNWGNLLFAGTPDDMVKKYSDTPTGKSLAQYRENRK